ncbi:homeobox-domain-containing protein [Lentinus tigrinus ALCF2SS1-6]|uniref:Homeobox-domain-containing protein n=1 Tax=Lentinus tigrinus ALCF2SS1-6 TaxID=1328759 RepID=A0A5C2RLR9_9APHY|nr:homeobox-domain-containing protein [Lentinus tigrinus ALCF2SS1-6]
MKAQHKHTSHSDMPTRPTENLPESQHSSFSSLRNWDGTQSIGHPVGYPTTTVQPGMGSTVDARNAKLQFFYDTCNKTPTLDEQMQLAHETGFTADYVARWFSNRREVDVAWAPAAHNTASAKPRTRFTDSQKAAMDACFSNNPYPSAEERKRLANSLRVDREAVDNWFHNKRNRSRAKK